MQDFHVGSWYQRWICVSSWAPMCLFGADPAFSDLQRAWTKVLH